jgi:small-conductance mechanosensitive channel
MSACRRAAAALLLAACTWLAAAADQAETVDTKLDGIRQQIELIQKTLADDSVTDATLVALRSTAVAAQAEAERMAEGLAPALANVQARQTELGPAPTGTSEAPDIAEQRANVAKTLKTLDAQVKLARLLAVESQQAADGIAMQRRTNFNARMGERTSSILASPFWNELRESLPRDALRLRALADELAAGARATPPGIWLMLLAASAGVLAARLGLRRLLLTLVPTRVPPVRLRRSLMAAGMTLLSVAAPGLIAHFLRLGFTWTGPPSPRVETLLVGAVGMVCFTAYVSSVGRALLSAKRPSWRLPDIPDGIALGLRRLPIVLSVVIFWGWVFDRLAGLVNAGLATAVAINCIWALALGGVMVVALLRGERLRRQGLAAAPSAAKEGSDAAPAATQYPWAAIGAAALWLVLMATLVCLLLGYVAFGSFVVKQVTWAATVLTTAYLVNALIDDVLMVWLGPPRGNAEGDARPHGTLLARQQAGVLLSALMRLAVLLFAVVLIAAPFGQGPLELFERADRVRDGITIGEIQLQPGTVMQALLVFVLGVVGVRLLQRWLADRYLPTTGLDEPMRQSAVTLLGYAGTVSAVALALSAVGLGLERIAWVASALSVGIGFGLQAVVQNFVSGLILLAERPVKVGDWVSLGGVEGDIRRINVRATEIQMGDRSTVIVPNSEFITKVVRNVTMDNPLGLVTIKLPMPLDTDVVRVRELLLAAFEAHERVLDTPRAAVELDGIDAGKLVFSATASVGSPRQVYGVKSALLFDMLKRLREAGIAVSAGPTMVLREVPAAQAGPPTP